MALTPAQNDELDARSDHGPSASLGEIPLEDYLEIVRYDPFKDPQVVQILRDLELDLRELLIDRAQQRVRQVRRLG